MNLEDFKKTISEITSEIEKGLSSTEQYAAFKENLEKIRTAAKKNPFIATISEVLINPISKELERAYKKFSDKSPTTYEGFDLVNDPKAMEKIRHYLETLEASHAAMSVEQFTQSLNVLVKVVDDLDHLKPETAKEEDFADDLRRRVIKLKLSSRPQNSPEKSPTTLVFRYHQTPFNITSKNFANEYRAYMEDVAVNAAAKDVKQLLEIGQVLNIIAEDLTQTQAESSDEEKFLNEVQIQTPLLLKIVDRQIALKSSALAQFHKRGETPQKAPESKTPVRKSAVVKKAAPKSSSSKAKKEPKVSAPAAKKVAKKAVKKAVKSAKPKKAAR